MLKGYRYPSNLNIFYEEVFMEYDKNICPVINVDGVI